MPWQCPACSTFIRPELKKAGHETPRQGYIYRCSICRLDLVLNDQGTQMVVAPLPNK